jgi:hypothetical protein
LPIRHGLLMLNLKNLDLKRLRKCKEKEFRLGIIIPLLKNHLGASVVRDLHGTNEQGIDVYFEFSDAFKKIRRYGIQLKIGNLKAKGRVDRNPNVIEICNQIEQAFGKEIPLIDKTNVCIDGFYIAITGTADERVCNHIFLKRKQYPYLHIIDGEHIIELIRQLFFFEIQKQILPATQIPPTKFLRTRGLS